MAEVENYGDGDSSIEIGDGAWHEYFVDPLLGTWQCLQEPLCRGAVMHADQADCDHCGTVRAAEPTAPPEFNWQVAHHPERRAEIENYCHYVGKLWKEREANEKAIQEARVTMAEKAFNIKLLPGVWKRKLKSKMKESTEKCNVM